jgi:hypothetical protein
MAELDPKTVTIKVDPPRVTVGLSYKRSTNDFENATVHVSIEDSQWPEEQKVGDTINRLWGKVKNEVVSKTLEIEQAFK